MHLILNIFQFKIAERIKEIRTDKKIDQKTLADKIGVAQSAVSQWEDGINEPKANYIMAMAEYFGVSSDYLLGLVD